MQLATTMGFVLGKRNGKFMGLTPAETSAIHDGRWLKICMPARTIACFCLCANVFVVYFSSSGGSHLGTVDCEE